MHFISGVKSKQILDWIKKRDNGDDTFYIQGKEDTEEAIGVFRSLYDKEYKDVIQLFNYLYDSLKLRKAGSNSFYRAFISLYYNDDIINIRLSGHFATKNSTRNGIRRHGKSDMEYHLVIDKEQTGSTKSSISKDTTYKSVKIRVVDIDLKEFNNEILDEIILLLTYGTTKRPSTNISVDKDGNYVSANGWGADFVSENKNINYNRKMNKKLIRLTESDLHRIVSESVNRVLNEVMYNGHHFDGNNPRSWGEVEKLRQLRSWRNKDNLDFKNAKKEMDKANRNHDNAMSIVDSHKDDKENLRQYKAYHSGLTTGRGLGRKLGLTKD